MANSVRIGVGVDDKASAPIQRIRDAFKTLQQEGARGFAVGAGAAITAKAFTLLEDAARGVVNVLGDSVQAAIADEQSQATLRTSLMANIPAWEGNTDAIEKRIAAGIKLGFADDEQRQSLALLVAATHDVNKAFNVQSVAMDLARFKGISLTAATEALTRVEGGSFRILKSLGIALKDGATAQDALNAVEAVAAGQREAFVSKTGGKLVVIQERINEKMEDLGYKILPVVADALEIVAGALDDMDNHKGPIVEIVNAFDDMGKQLDFLAGGPLRHAGEETDFLGSKTTALGVLLHDIFDAGWRDRLGDAGLALQRAGEITEGATTKIRTFGEVAASSAEKAAEAFDDMVTALKSDVDRLIGEVYDPIEERDHLMTNRIEADRLRAIIASKKSTDAEIKDAKRKLRSLEADNVEYLTKLLESGDITETEYARLMRILQTKSKTATGKAKEDVDTLIAKVKELYRVMVSGPNVQIGLSVHPVNKNGPGKAKGGPTMPWQTYTVGEHGPETLVMGDESGFVIPHGGGAPMGLSGGLGMAGGGMSFYFSFPGMTVAPTQAQAAQIGRAVGPAVVEHLRSRGLLPR
jgi:hypothetical protein